MKLDPVTFNVLSHAFRSIATEMGTVLVKSAYSSIVREAKDAATSLLDSEGRVVAQSQMIPMQLNSLAAAFDYLRLHFKLEEVKPDEAFITNNPYHNGQHLNDILLFLPAFDGDCLVGFSGTVCHHADIGGPSALNDKAVHLIEEGLVIPAMKLPLDYLVGGPLSNLLLANVRATEMVAGDFRAQISACQRGCRLLLELVDKYSRESVTTAMAELQDYAERLMRKRLAGLADGTYDGEDFADGHKLGDQPIHIRARLEISGDTAHIDLSDCADQVNAPLNSPIASTQAAVYGFFAGLLPSGSPVNEGTYRPIEIKTRKGSICDPIPPAPVRSRMAVCYAISGALRRAIGARMPETVAACGDDTSTAIVFSYRQDGTHRIHVEIVGGGNGASAKFDGADGIAQCLANSSNMPIEALETSFHALRIVEYALIPDSGGAGKHRGGCGIRRVYEVLTDGVVVQTSGDGHMTAPWGLAGGGNGTFSVKRLERGTETVELRALSTTEARKGDRFVIETSGGGGYGSPAKRARDNVLSDMADGLVYEEKLK
ncbi:MAG: hydantoinase B/oxoprolinase family protein [Gammaproteobacteria bacterium]|nr:hydantoinase B/oxoprolinase family protein [Gammaproteobacteria bacterium]